MEEYIILNESQLKATEHNKGPMMVLAGPGSGKTTVIIYRIKNLLKKYNIPPNNILTITFTKSAATEMKTRFYQIFEHADIKNKSVSFGTFHSFFFRILRASFNYNIDCILEEDKKSDIIKEIISKMELDIEDEEDFVSNIINEISLVKNELTDINTYNSIKCNTAAFRNIFNEYECYKFENNKIDFDDMVVKCYYLLKENPKITKFWQSKYPYILIDEFQDVNKAQYECIKLLSPKNGNIFIVGDDDQSIYKFRGARPEFLMKFPSDFENVKKIVLDINYRSTNQIIRLCNAVIKSNRKRYEKVIKGTEKTGNTPILIKSDDISQEAITIAKKIIEFKRKINLNKIAVIYRTNIQSRAIVDTFMDFNIPFQLKDQIQSIYNHWIANDFFAYFNLILNKDINNSFERILNKPKRYINKELISLSKKAINERGSGSIVEYMLFNFPLKSWQIEKLEEFIHHLKKLKNKNTYDAFKYIRNTIGYDEYIDEYAKYRKISSKGMFEIADEIQESAKGYSNISEYLKHIEDVREEIKQNLNNKNKIEREGVVLSTIHSAKGLEFDVVFITSAVEGVIPHERSITIDEIEEERRLFYVAMTRAKQLLYISIIKSRYENSVEPTRFLKQFIKPGGKNEKFKKRKI